MEIALKNSIFEFYTTGIIIVNKDKQFDDYQLNKSKCSNCQTKVLFHGTKIEYSSKILPTNFKVGKDCWYGLGVYFTDQIDYARYYWNGWDSEESCVNIIPNIGESFSIIASEIYYDKNNFLQIYDLNKKVKLNEMPDKNEIFEKYKDKIVQKNGIHYVEVNYGNCEVIPYSGIYNKKLMKGTEYVVTYSEQMLPLYGLTLKRVEYCIIWYDPSFSDEKYQKEIKEKKMY